MNGPESFDPRIEARVQRYLRESASGERRSVVERVQRRIGGRSPRELIELERLRSVRRLSAAAALVLVSLAALTWSREASAPRAVSVDDLQIAPQDELFSMVTLAEGGYATYAGERDLLLAMFGEETR